MLIDKFDKHFPKYYSNPFKHDEYKTFDYIDQSTLCEDIYSDKEHVIYWFDADFDINSYKSMVVKVYSINSSTNEPESEIMNFNGNIKKVDTIEDIKDVAVNYVGIIHDKQYRCAIFLHKNYNNMFVHVEYKSSGYSNTGKVNKIYSKMTNEIELWNSKPSDESILENRTINNIYDECFLRDSYNSNYYNSYNIKFINAMKRDHSSTCNELTTIISNVNQQKFFHIIKELSGNQFDFRENTAYARYGHTSACTNGPTVYIGTEYTVSRNTYSYFSINYQTSIINKPSNINNGNSFIPVNNTSYYTIGYGKNYRYKNRIVVSIIKNLYELQNSFSNNFIKLNNASNSYSNVTIAPYLPASTNINIDINWSVTGGVTESKLYAHPVYWPVLKGTLSRKTISNLRTSTITSKASYILNPDIYSIYDKDSSTYEMANNIYKIYIL